MTDTVKHMWGQVEKARADGTCSSEQAAVPAQDAVACTCSQAGFPSSCYNCDAEASDIVNALRKLYSTHPICAQAANYIERKLRDMATPSEPLQCLRCGTVDAFGPAARSPAEAAGLQHELIDRILGYADNCEADKMIEASKDLRAACDLIIGTKSAINRLKGDLAQALAQVEYGRKCLLEIQKAAVEGRVCDDVAWFSTIETLHDYCAVAADRLSPSSTMLKPPAECPECGLTLGHTSACTHGREPPPDDLSNSDYAREPY